MIKLIVSVTAGIALAIGGAGLASAQEAETEPAVTVDKGEVEPDGEVNVNITNADPAAPYTVDLGEGTAEGETDAEGAASAAVNVGAVELGPLDGLVTINGVEYPINVVVAAAGAGDTGGAGATPLPATGVDDSGTLAALAAVLVLFGVALFAASRRSARAA